MKRYFCLHTGTLLREQLPENPLGQTCQEPVMFPYTCSAAVRGKIPSCPALCSALCCWRKTVCGADSQAARLGRVWTNKHLFGLTFLRAERTSVLAGAPWRPEGDFGDLAGGKLSSGLEDFFQEPAKATPIPPSPWLPWPDLHDTNRSILLMKCFISPKTPGNRRQCVTAFQGCCFSPYGSACMDK